MDLSQLSLNGLLSQVFGQASATVVTSDPETTVAIRVLGRVQAHVFGRWREAQRQGLECEMHFAPPGAESRKCTQPMIGLCSVCHRPVCLSHSAVHLETGTPLCFGCIELARQVNQRGGGPPPGTAAEQAKLRRKHLRRLKLSGQPSESEILTAFRRIAAQTHPDRVPAERKARAHKQFVALGASRDWLLNDLKSTAA